MKVALERAISKHLFGKSVDTEQVFVMGCRHGERRFDAWGSDPGASDAPLEENDPPGGVTPALYNEGDTDSRCDDWSDDRTGNRKHNRKDVPMTALLTAPLPEYLTDELPRPDRPALRLIQAPERHGGRHHRLEEADDWSRLPMQVPRRRVSVEVRRRRTLLAMMGLALGLLALPLGGSGGASHPSGSVSAAQLHSGTYTVRAGDTLWSIAQRLDPTGDPRPVVSQLAAQLGAYTVVPGQKVTVP
jgi:hypothetical protein